MEKSYQHKSTEIFYQDIGHGAPVLLLHGFGEDSRVWHHQVDFLKDYCRLIIPNLPGSGKTIDNGNPLIASSIEEMAETIFALMVFISTKPFIVLGHSMGGYITLAIAEKHAEKLTGFGLIHSTAFADSDEKKATRHKGISFIQKNGAYSFLQTATPGLFTEGYKNEHADKVEELIEQGKNFASQSLVSYYEAMIARPDRTSVLKQSKVPVLFIVGKDDKAVPMEDALQQVPLPNVSYVHILKNSAHMGMWEETGLMNQYLLEFIQQIK
jgi:pimeloyl-ACP methyl ester carboxylesterase